MMGWITLLKEKQKDADPILEIEKDIERLKVISPYDCFIFNAYFMVGFVFIFNAS